MKHIAKILAVGAVLAATAQFASAGSIYGVINVASSPNGSVVYDITGSDLSATFDGTGTSAKTTSGTLTAIPLGTSVTTFNFDTSMPFTPITGTEIFSTTSGATTVKFFANSGVGTFNSDNTIVGVTFMGYLTETGYTDTAAKLLFSSQGGPGDPPESFSETAMALTPEPSRSFFWERASSAPPAC